MWYANGALTLGENIADHGGVEVSFQAFQNAIKKNPLPDKDGITPEQRFFISYAQLWASNVREEFIRYLIQNDVHSFNKCRVDGVLPHINAWYETFNITPTDSMCIKPEDRVKGSNRSQKCESNNIYNRIYKMKMEHNSLSYTPLIYLYLLLFISKYLPYLTSSKSAS